MAAGAKVTAFRKRQSDFQKCFRVNQEKNFAYCHDVDELMKAMEINYKAEDWRVFIDSGKDTLKAILLDTKNEKPSVPIAYGTDTKI